MKLLKKYAKNHWCLIVDADEMFVYPYYEHVSLKDLCAFLDQEGSTAVGSFLLDMYSKQKTRDVNYKKGDNLLSAYPYFDGTKENMPIVEVDTMGREYRRGGVRKRLFGVTTLLNKVCLFKYSSKVVVEIGQHYVKGVTFSEIEGSTLHFKYTPSFTDYVINETKRGEHWGEAVEYKVMAESLSDGHDVNFYYSGSVQFKDSKQLVDLGFMKTTDRFEAFLEKFSGGTKTL